MEYANIIVNSRNGTREHELSALLKEYGVEPLLLPGMGLGLVYQSLPEHAPFQGISTELVSSSVIRMLVIDGNDQVWPHWVPGEPELILEFGFYTQEQPEERERTYRSNQEVIDTLIAAGLIEERTW